MGGISSKVTNTNNKIIPRNDRYQLSSNVIDYKEPELSADVSVIDQNSDIELNKIVEEQLQYYKVSGKEMSESLHHLLQQIQLNILANNYNEKNKQILKKLMKEANNKRAELKDSKEANLADYRRIELIQSEIKQKNRTILFVTIASIVLLLLLVISFIFLRSNINLTIPNLKIPNLKLTIPFRLPRT